MIEMKLIVNIGLKIVFGSFVSGTLAAMLRWSPPGNDEALLVSWSGTYHYVSEPHMNTGFLLANLSGHFVAQLIYPHNILWAIIFSVIIPYIIATNMTTDEGNDQEFVEKKFILINVVFSDEISNLFQYSGYCLIGILLGYSAANFVALVKIMWIGYNQFYRNAPDQPSPDQMFTAREDL